MKKSTKRLWKNFVNSYENSSDILGPLLDKITIRSMNIFEQNMIFFREPAEQILKRLREYTEPL